jgi:transposase
MKSGHPWVFVGIVIVRAICADGQEAPMEPVYVIAMDAHCQFTEFFVTTPSGRPSRRGRTPTTMPALREVVRSVRRPRHVLFEEGPLAEWMLRGLLSEAERVVACNPRRNALIAKEGDKDDPIDAIKLNRLYRGGFTEPVHHPKSFERAAFKRLIVSYHEAVARRSRLINATLAKLRWNGIFVRQGALSAERQKDTLSRLPSCRAIRTPIELLLDELDQVDQHVDRLRRMVTREARANQSIRRLLEVPGIGWIRAATFVAYIDTPWRFRSKSALWKYMGIGLQRRTSGGGAALVRVVPNMRVCRPLKNMILGAAGTVILMKQQPFYDRYWRWHDEGLTPRNARRNVARGLASVLWGMLKSGDVYHPELVGGVSVDGDCTATAMDG